MCGLRGEVKDIVDLRRFAAGLVFADKGYGRKTFSRSLHPKFAASFDFMIFMDSLDPINIKKIGGL
jgi:hypothetical protein